MHAKAAAAAMATPVVEVVVVVESSSSSHVVFFSLVCSPNGDGDGGGGDGDGKGKGGLISGSKELKTWWKGWNERQRPVVVVVTRRRNTMKAGPTTTAEAKADKCCWSWGLMTMGGTRKDGMMKNLQI